MGWVGLVVTLTAGHLTDDTKVQITQLVIRRAARRLHPAVQQIRYIP
ncbi:hypothetical protein [Paenibacillus sp. Soil522]|nr:hypothetical protein [Paenibacillus sp. Soil522]